MKPFPTPALDNSTHSIYWLHKKLYNIVRTGYCISIVCLVIALSIFTLLRRLQNARVRIHMNLFISMLFVSTIWLSQGLFYGQRIFLSLITDDLYSGYDTSTACVVLMVFGNYFELTCFTWILMESYYFYIFICRKPYKECSSIKPLIICGWGMPLLVIIPYVTAYLLAAKTNFCWVDVDSKTNILAIPILIMILVNLCFFILNVRVLFIKLNCSVLNQRQMHFWKWFKSTMMLVPLFGAYDIFFSVEPWIEDKTVKSRFYIFIRILCSIQGFLVSTLYCFMNKEVRDEIQRVWKNWMTKKEIHCNILKQQNDKKKRSGQALSSQTSFDDLSTNLNISNANV